MNQLRYRKGWPVLTAASLLLAAGVGLGISQRDVSGQDSKTREGTTPAAAVEHANSLSQAFRSAAEQATPTVVKIRSHTDAKPVSTGRNGRGNRQRQNPFGGQNPFEGTPFEDFFGDGFDMDQFRGRIPQRDGVGSGVIIDEAGIVLTNNHVVEGADEVTVHLPDGREFTATDIKTDPQSDLAVLRIKADGDLPAAKLGDSDALEIGDWVIAIGNPFELDTTVSAGIISGKERELTSIRRAKFLQTDAAINPGNSGGPLVNLNGEVIGINTAIASNSGGYQGIGFAIPINQAKWITNQLIKTGSVQRGYLGVGIQELTSDLAEQLGVKRGQGVVVGEVFPGSPAAEAGFEPSDVIVEFAGKKVGSPRELQENVERSKIDSEQPVKVVRDGKTRTLNVTVKALPEDLASRGSTQSRPQRGQQSDGFEAEGLGFEVSELNAQLAQQLGIESDEGVVITSVDDNGPAAEKGLATGMVIRRVGRQDIKSLDDFKAALEDADLKEGVLLQVQTSAGKRILVLKAE